MNPAFQRPSRSLNPPLVSPEGLWTGLTVCVFMQASFFVIFLCRLDWQKASKEVSHVAVFAVYLKVNVAKLLL